MKILIAAVIFIAIFYLLPYLAEEKEIAWAQTVMGALFGGVAFKFLLLIFLEYVLGLSNFSKE